MEDIQRHASSYGKTSVALVPYEGVRDHLQTMNGHTPVFVDGTKEGIVSLRNQNDSSMSTKGTLIQYRDQYQGDSNSMSNVSITLEGAHSMLAARTG